MPPKQRQLRGLQKLKFYCQVCQKQLKDANAFQNHCQSDSHLRKMELFSQNQDKQLSEFSTQFEQSFLDTLKGHFGTSKVDANHVYNLLIRDKHHVHLNATRWTSVSGFVQYLAKTGKAVIEPHPVRGWWIQYVDKVAEERDMRAQLLKEQEVSRSFADRVLDHVTANGVASTAPRPSLPDVAGTEEEDGDEIEIEFSLDDYLDTGKREKKGGDLEEPPLKKEKP
ncbi:hypothetical protein P9112_004376 [Eukaryota sp. TZLM1-RC]